MSIDNWRGIPVNMHPTEGRPTVQVVMTILHAGGNKIVRAGYADSGGLHSVGISVVNALSSHVKVIPSTGPFARMVLQALNLI